LNFGWVGLPLITTTTIMATTEAAVVEKKSPSDFLRHVIGRPVIVKLVSGITYHGILAW
jgi:hypothetical protein